MLCFISSPLSLSLPSFPLVNLSRRRYLCCSLRSSLYSFLAVLPLFNFSVRFSQNTKRNKTRKPQRKDSSQAIVMEFIPDSALGLLQPLQLDKQELYDIFQDEAFSNFVDRHMKFIFAEDCLMDFVCSSVSCVTTPPYQEQVLLFGEEEETEDEEPSVQNTPPQSPPRTPKRIPINKWGKLPRLSHFNTLRRTKTNKIVWSLSLQQRFLVALELLGIDEAMPSDILYIMNVDGLTRPNISSHLQKYRQKLVKKKKGAIVSCCAHRLRQSC